MVEYYGDHFEINEECCDEFSIVEDNEDSFRMWQGLVGPYYTPYLSQDGTLSFTNNGSLPNPEPVNVRGPQGAGIRIAGIVSSEEYLPASAAEGDIWLVGESAPYEGYSLNAGQWIDLGPLTVGPAGPPGPQGEAGEPGPAGQDGSDGADGVSPEVTVESITGGHTVTITDADHPSGQSFDVMDGQDGDDGVSPEVTVESITGGHTVTITDADHPSGQSFNVMDGQDGDTGPQGPAGPGVPAGGSAGQFYRKASGTDYDGEWHTLSAGDSSYDSSLTYSSGTVGQELSSQRNTLNALKSVTTLTGISSLAVLKSSLITLATSMEINDILPIRFYASFTDSGIVSGNYYIGHLTVITKSGSAPDRLTVLLSTNDSSDVVAISMVGSSWKINSLTKTEEITTGITGVTAFINGNVVTLKITKAVTTSSAGWFLIGTLPNRLKPPAELRFLVFDNNVSSFATNSCIPIQVTSAGQINVYFFSDRLTYSLWGTATYTAL